MKTLSKIIIIVGILSLTACSSQITREEKNFCVWTTSLISGVAASPSGVGAVLASAVGGAAAAQVFCGDVGAEQTQPEPEMMAEIPKADLSGHFHIDDQDLDGVRDGSDRCPFTPENIAVDTQGCAHDDDNDGVPNYLDQCLDTPAGLVVNWDGCHDGRISPDRIVASLDDVHFAFNSATLTSQAKSVLNSNVKALSAGKYIIEGHTDNVGTDAYNDNLSRQRAVSVRRYLISQGVNSSSLSIKAKGESQPVASNDSESGRALNRRVVIYSN